MPDTTRSSRPGRPLPIVAVTTNGTSGGDGADAAAAPSRRSGVIGPGAVSVRLRTPEVPAAARFAPTDPPPAWDISSHPRIGALLRSRKFQFLAVLPNQILFWMVIFIGLAGTAVPGLNFGAAITWYVWFALLFVMMVVAGRAWCLMCPFGAFGEWVQKLTLWGHSHRRLTLGRKLPERWAGYGALISTAIFIGLTWIEEFFNIAGPGNPITTGWLVVGIISGALVFFVVFERRTFCRYLCPLTSMIATFATMGSLAGFRTRDRTKCLSCETKECMRGGSHGAGCPWYTWPGATDSNAYCGLCTECYKACPYDNIGLFVQPPLTSVVAPRHRRVDIGWTLAGLAGLVLYQQVNAMPIYTPVDDWLNAVTHFPHYPNPIDYLAVIAGVAVVLAAVGWAMSRLFGTAEAGPPRSGGRFLVRQSRFRSFFVPVMYGMIPVVGADYFARQLPKFLKHVTRVPVSFEHLWGAGSTHSWLYNYRLLSNPQIVDVQIAVVTLGALASAWACWRVAGRELVPIVRQAPWATWGVRLTAVTLPLTTGLSMSVLYAAMNAAT